MKKKINLDELTQYIESRRKDVNFELYMMRKKHKRQSALSMRSPGERQALDELAKHSWENAEKEGKIKRTGPRKMFYDID